MRRILLIALGVAAATPAMVAQADDLTGANRFLCASVQATMCVEDGECAVDVPWNFNIPDFVEIDLEGNRVATTEASGENRDTAIEHLSRKDGSIVFHGFEMGRAFSWVIDEQTGRTTVALAGDGISMAIFGTCTPLAAAGPVAE